MDKLPNEVVNPILEIVSYVFTFITGVLAKWLQGRNKNKKNEQA